MFDTKYQLACLFDHQCDVRAIHYSGWMTQKQQQLCGARETSDNNTFEILIQKINIYAFTSK